PQEPQQPQGPQEERKPPQPQPQEPQQPQGPQEERKPPQPQPQEPQQPQGPQEERKPPQPQPRKPPVALKPVQPGTETGQPKHLQQKLSLVPETEEEEEYEIAGDADDDEEERKEETETKEENADDEFEESLIRSGSIDGMLEFLRQATQTANERNCGCVKRLNCAVTGMVQLKDSVDERKQQLIKLQEQIAELKAKAAMPPPPPRIPPPPPPPSPVIKVQRLVELKKKQKKQLAKDSNIDESLIEGLKTELKSRLKAGQGLRPVTNRAARPEPAPAKASSQADEQLRLRMEKIRRRLSQRQAPTEEPRAKSSYLAVEHLKENRIPPPSLSDYLPVAARYNNNYSYHSLE
uniref:WH2 domain-containing protein n=1 Tax=Macrostomum lignano TaxID=282301 RepID=A0A1I8HDT6_9PLAT